MSLTAKWIALYLFVWIIGTFLGSTYDGYSTTALWSGSGSGGYSQAPKTTVEGLINGNTATQRLAAVGPVSFVSSTFNWFNNAFKVLTWRWSFLEPYPMLAWILTCFGAMGFLSLFMLIYGLIRGNVSW